MRLRSRWLRYAEDRSAPPLIVGPAVLDVYARRVVINGYQLRLPAKEIALLRLLMLNPTEWYRRRNLPQSTLRHAKIRLSGW